MWGLRTAIVVMAMASFSALPARANASWSDKLPVPGTVNYVEGQASIGMESLNAKSAGAVALQPGQTLTTQQGNVEILLTPDVFLRVGPNSAVKMISPSLSRTEIAVQRGDAEVEVDHLFQQNRLLVRDAGTTARLEKKGVYDFDAHQPAVRVLKGEALLHLGDEQVKIKGGHEVALNASELNSQKFNKDTFEAKDGLYRWGKLRNEYLREDEMQQYPYYAWSPWGPGWGWGPVWGWGPAWGWGGWWW